MPLITVPELARQAVLAAGVFLIVFGLILVAAGLHEQRRQRPPAGRHDRDRLRCPQCPWAGRGYQRYRRHLARRHAATPRNGIPVREFPPGSLDVTMPLWTNDARRHP